MPEALLDVGCLIGVEPNDHGHRVFPDNTEGVPLNLGRVKNRIDFEVIVQQSHRIDAVQRQGRKAAVGRGLAKPSRPSGTVRSL